MLADESSIDDELTIGNIIDDELNNSDILPSYTTYLYSDELKSSTDEVYKYTTWYAYERFYSTIDKRFISKDPVVSLYEKERVNSYIYAGDNPLKNIDPDGRSFICKVVNSTVFKKAMDLCEGIYDVTSFALNRAYKDVVKPLADIYNKASDIMDKIPTPVKIAAGLVGGAIAIGTGIAPAIVAGTMIKVAVSGAVISGAMYGVSSLFTGNFDKKEFVNSMLHGAADMFMISGVTLGVKGVVDCVTRNSGRIREAMLANEEGSSNIVEKLDDFYESRVRGKTSYGKSSENVVKGESEVVDVKLSRKKYPESAQHIEEAIKEGQPDILTIDRRGASSRRKASLQGVNTVPGLDRDEYPPAMSKEGGTGASVKLINPSDNRGSGPSISGKLRKYPNGTKYRIIITDEE